MGATFVAHPSFVQLGIFLRLVRPPNSIMALQGGHRAAQTHALHRVAAGLHVAAGRLDPPHFSKTASASFSCFTFLTTCALMIESEGLGMGWGNVMGRVGYLYSL